MKPKKFKFKKPQEAGMEVAEEFVKSDSYKTDPQGWYTGKSETNDKRPVQDADDL